MIEPELAAIAKAFGGLVKIYGKAGEAKLKQSGLTDSQIAAKDILELKESLLEINKLADSGSDEILQSVLLERKRLVIDRIQELSSKEKIENLQDVVDQLPEEEVKNKLSIELATLREDAAKYKQDIKDIAVREAEAAIKLEQQHIDGLERKSKIWLSFLQRESAASIIGGIVLLMLTVALISGMILGTESQILSNGFLVILGYFFGQSSSKNKDGM